MVDRGARCASPKTFLPHLELLSLGDERDAESEEGNQAVEGKRLDAGSRQASGQDDQAGCRPITLPQHKGRDYPTGLAQAILKQAELKMKELHLWS